jgi:hypothetical protein
MCKFCTTIWTGHRNGFAEYTGNQSIYNLPTGRLTHNELPRVIQQFNAKVIVIADLLNLFTLDPNIDLDEAIFLIKEIINSIRKTREYLSYSIFSATA